MKRNLFMACLLLLPMSAVCSAESMNLELSVGSTSVAGVLNAKRNTASGFYQFGGDFVYADDDETEYKYGALRLNWGNETLVSGLTFDLGLRSILGDAEDGLQSGDIGVFGLMGNVKYLIAPERMPFPLELIGSLTWGPKILSFEDADGYCDWTLGLGVRALKNLSIIGTYTKYNIDMESGPGDWELDEDELRLGVILYF